MKINFKIKLKDESGFAAIVIAMIMVTILSLITIGFAQLMRKATISALNAQLSTQAYNAAESGVNAAAAAINEGYNLPKTICGDTENVQGGVNTGLSGANFLEDNTVGGKSSPTGASYPCLLINPTPPNYQADPIDTVNSTVAEMEGINPATGAAAPIQTMEISWENSDPGSPQFAPNCNTFYPANQPVGTPQWNYTGILRTELFPVNNLTRSSLINSEMTTYLCPDQSLGNTIGYNSGVDTGVGSDNGHIVDGDCNASNNPYCSVYITGLSQSIYFLVLKSIYTPTQVTVTLYGADSTGSTAPTNILDIADAQFLVDSTGKAQNVLKRIQVRIPTHDNYYYPPNGGAASVCKELKVQPAGSSSPNPNCSNIPS